MNNLIIKKTIDSREVAQMVGKDHFHLMRDITNYAEILGEVGASNYGLSDFFIESSYLTSQNKKMPCYLLTKKGCEFVANKMTGRKGTLFTAAYVTRFNEMADTLKNPKLLKEERLCRNTMIREARMMFDLAKTFKKQLSAETVQLLISAGVELMTGEQLIPQLCPKLQGGK